MPTPRWSFGLLVYSLGLLRACASRPSSLLVFGLLTLHPSRPNSLAYSFLLPELGLKKQNWAYCGLGLLANASSRPSLAYSPHLAYCGLGLLLAHAVGQVHTVGHQATSRPKPLLAYCRLQVSLTGLPPAHTFGLLWPLHIWPTGSWPTAAITS